MGCLMSVEASEMSSKCIFGSCDLGKCQSSCLQKAKEDVGEIEHQCADIISKRIDDVIKTHITELIGTLTVIEKARHEGKRVYTAPQLAGRCTPVPDEAKCEEVVIDINGDELPMTIPQLVRQIAVSS